MEQLGNSLHIDHIDDPFHAGFDAGEVEVERKATSSEADSNAQI